MIIESCHELVPPDEIKPLIEKIIANYITEFCNNQHITIGLNAIREILMRMPLALDESQIEYLCLFRTFRNASVVAASKSLINYFRDVCPNLLPRKFRGRFTKIDEDNAKENFVYGKQKINYGIDGIDLLKKSEGVDPEVNLAATRILDDTDLRKIKVLKLRQAVKKVDRKGFASSSEEESEQEEGSGSEEDEFSQDGDDEEGEEEFESGEEGEDEFDEDEEDGSSIEYDGEDEGAEEEEDEESEEEEIAVKKPKKKEEQTLLGKRKRSDILD